MTRNEEIWVIASTLLTAHGDDAPLHVAASMGELMMSGDAGGVEHWKEISRCLEQLMNRGTTQ